MIIDVEKEEEFHDVDDKYDHAYMCNMADLDAKMCHCEGGSASDGCCIEDDDASGDNDVDILGKKM